MILVASPGLRNKQTDKHFTMKMYFNVIQMHSFLVKVLVALARNQESSAVSMLHMATGRGKFSYVVPLSVPLTVEAPWCQISGWSQPLTVSEENSPALSL